MDSADFFGVRLSPPESASVDALADWLADSGGSDRIRRGLSLPIIVPKLSIIVPCLNLHNLQTQFFMDFEFS